MRTVAILGRPNVGKSTLFNRLTRSRRALVHDQPGLTRDRLEGEVELYGLAFRLLDTAGLEADAAGTLAGRLWRLSFAGLDEADVALFVIDARAGVTPLDRAIANELRRSGKPVVLVANKAEGRAGEPGLLEAWELGLDEPVAVSAEHGLGLADLADALQPHLSSLDGIAASPSEANADGEAAEDDRPLRLAIVGRPNVGKSTLVNRLLQSDRLLTGPEPGLTRDAVTIAWQWEGRRIDLVDTAGLRRKSRIDAAPEKLSASASVRAIRLSHVVALVIDAQTPIEHQDLTIAGLALEEGRALVLVLNKWDLVGDHAGVLRLVRERLADSLSQVKGLPIVTLSAGTGRRVETLLPVTVGAYDRWRRRIPTGQLNRWLGDVLAKHPPPMAQNRRIKIRYVTQVAMRPPTFALFANKPADMLPGSYMRYLENSLRDAFDLEGVPLRLRVRHGENPYDDRS